MPDRLTDFDDMRRYSNAVRLQREREIEAVTQKLIDGEIGVGAWQSEMLYQIKQGNIDAALIANGGTTDGMSKADLVRLRTSVIGSEMSKQRAHLRKFAKAIEAAADEGRSLEFARARAKMYAKSSQAMFWRRAVPVELPQVPRDGKTKCRTNCKCRLKIKRQGKEIWVWWKLSPAEHCEDCLELGREWNPLKLTIDEAVEESSIEQAVWVLIESEPDLRADAAWIEEIFELERTKHVCAA